jgi:hypothetical protein
MAKAEKKGKVGATNERVTGGADLSKGYKSLGKYNPATAPTGPTSDTMHKGYRTATGGKAS